MLPKLLGDSSVLHFAPGVDDSIDELVFSGFKNKIAPQKGAVHALKDVRLLTAQLRWVKDAQEIRAIRHAVDITAHGFRMLLPTLKEAVSEAHAAAMLQSYFARLGAPLVGFPTIVASGRNATVLHHEPTLQPLWKRELVLIDAGAYWRGYSGDITRTVPVSGHFQPAHAAVYDVVVRAVKAAVAKSKPGNTLEAIYEAAVAELIEGLVDLKIFKGRHDPQKDHKRLSRYFMHRVSHWLGLDVHDIWPLGEEKSNGPNPSHARPLVPGNVFTIEPGLYFDLKDETVPKQFRGIGIRVEEDILITETGCEVLSSKIPIDRIELESLLG